MAKTRLLIQLDEETLERVDQARGDVPRAAWIRRATEDRLRALEPKKQRA